MEYKKILKNRELRLKLINMLSWMPNKPYLKMVYRIKTGCKLDLKNPRGFNEKLNWLKLNDIHPEYTDLADKIKVREYIEKKLGKEYLIPLLGVWDSFEEIDFDKLPDSFVLKCNHDSGSVKIIRSKADIDKIALKRFFDNRIKMNPYCLGREYPYKIIKPKIFAEKLMASEKQGGGINDYKLFCFEGKPEIMFIATERLTDCKFDFFDMDFKHLDVVNIHPQSGKEIERPSCFEEMKRIATALSKGKTFVRIDLYEIDGRVYFGEFTFFHGGGFYLFHPEKWEKKLGDLLNID